MVDSRRYFKEGGNEMKKSVEKKLFITICLAPAMILLNTVYVISNDKRVYDVDV